ncbi:hypothetical protein U1Q18_051533 [Sarracenia purpurea var. burkii]
MGCSDKSSKGYSGFFKTAMSMLMKRSDEILVIMGGNPVDRQYAMPKLVTTQLLVSDSSALAVINFLSGRVAPRTRIGVKVFSAAFVSCHVDFLKPGEYARILYSGTPYTVQRAGPNLFVSTLAVANFMVCSRDDTRIANTMFTIA